MFVSMELRRRRRQTHTKRTLCVQARDRQAGRRDGSIRISSAARSTGGGARRERTNTHTQPADTTSSIGGLLCVVSSAVRVRGNFSFFEPLQAQFRAPSSPYRVADQDKPWLLLVVACSMVNLLKPTGRERNRIESRIVICRRRQGFHFLPRVFRACRDRFFAYLFLPVQLVSC